MLAILAIGGDVDGKILVTQGLRDLLRKKSIILDQKNSHAPCPSFGTNRLVAQA
jgi:hypothetical protein